MNRGLRVLFAAALAACPAVASGPMAYDARFWFEQAPGPTLERLVAGEVGILDLGQDPEQLLVAYRHLSGLGLDSVSREHLLAALQPKAWDAAEARGEHEWLEARKRIPTATPLGWLNTDRQFERVETDYTWIDDRRNCLSDAFVTAARTLRSRIEEHGAEDPAVHEWLRGQDQVFALCSQGEEPPAALDESWPAWLRHDREYQIAAGHFYAFHSEEALRRFETIATDPESPWRNLARYLIARVALRGQNPDRATRAVEAVLADPALAELHPAARRLADLIAIRHRPAERRRELEARLSAPSLSDLEPAVLRQNVIDFVWLAAARTPGEGLPPGDLEQWLAVFLARSAPPEPPPGVAAAPPEPHPALRLWQEKNTLPWLVAALAVARGTEPEVPALLAAAARVPNGSPGAVPVGYHRARLLFARGGADGEGREVLDGLLRRKDLSLAVANRIKQQRAAFASTLDEYLSFSLLEPVELGYSDGTVIWTDEPVTLPHPKLLTDEAVAYLNRAVPTRELVRLASEVKLLPDDWRRRIGLVAWVGAVLERDGALAERVLPALEPLVPAALAAELERWQATPPGPDRDFGFHLLLLRWPGLSPRLEEDIGRRAALDDLDALRNNGWCARGGLAGSAWLEPVRFLSPDVQKAAAAEEPWADLAPTVLEIGPAVIAYVESHRDDPRAPEALHRVVRFTRYGCGWGDEVGKVSKRAFELLHRRYPRSEWADKTPYWFNG